jgi:hypothetical protein
MKNGCIFNSFVLQVTEYSSRVRNICIHCCRKHTYSLLNNFCNKCGAEPRRHKSSEKWHQFPNYEADDLGYILTENATLCKIMDTISQTQPVHVLFLFTRCNVEVTTYFIYCIVSSTKRYDLWITQCMIHCIIYCIVSSNKTYDLIMA